MNTKLQAFLDINRPIISNVFSFVCSSGQKIVYIFMTHHKCANLHLLGEAEDEDDGWLEVYPLTTYEGQEETMRGCTGEFVKI